MAEDLGKQAEFQAAINKAIADRAALLEKQNNLLSNQAQLEANLRNIASQRDQNQRSSASSFSDAASSAANAREKEQKDMNKQLSMADRLRASRKENIDLQEQATEAQEEYNKQAKTTAELMDEAKFEAKGLFSDIAKRAPIAVGAIGGLVKGFKDVGSVLSGVGGIISSVVKGVLKIGMAILAAPFKMIQGIAEMSRTAAEAGQGLRDAYEGVRKTFGSLASGPGGKVVATFKAARKHAHNFGGTGRSIASIYGYGPDGAAKALEDITGTIEGLENSMGGLSQTMSTKNIEALTAWKNQMGLSNEEAGLMTKMAKLSGQSVTTMMVKVTAAAKSMQKHTGISFKLIVKDIATMKADFISFGHMGEFQMAALSAYARKMGVSVKDLSGVMDKYMSFEGAADSISQLNQAFGMQLDIMKMMKAQNPAEQVEQLRQSFFNTGRSIEDMTIQEKKLMQQQTGMTDAMMKAAFSADNQAMSYKDLQNQADKDKKKKLDQTKVLKQLADALVKFTGLGPKLGGVGDALYQGFMRALSLHPEMRKLMKTVDKTLRVIKQFGFELGNLFMDLASKTGLFDAVNNILNSDAFVTFKNNIIGALRDLGNYIIDPNAVGSPDYILDKFPNAFMKFGQAKGPAFRKLKMAFEKIGKMIWKLLKVVWKYIEPKVVEGIKKIGGFLKKHAPAIKKALGLSFGAIFGWVALKALIGGVMSGVTMWILSKAVKTLKAGRKAIETTAKVTAEAVGKGTAKAVASTTEATIKASANTTAKVSARAVVEAQFKALQEGAKKTAKPMAEAMAKATAKPMAQAGGKATGRFLSGMKTGLSMSGRILGKAARIFGRVFWVVGVAKGIGDGIVEGFRHDGPIAGKVQAGVKGFGVSVIDWFTFGLADAASTRKSLDRIFGATFNDPMKQVNFDLRTSTKVSARILGEAAEDVAKSSQGYLDYVKGMEQARIEALKTGKALGIEDVDFQRRNAIREANMAAQAADAIALVKKLGLLGKKRLAIREQYMVKGAVMDKYAARALKTSGMLELYAKQLHYRKTVKGDKVNYLQLNTLRRANKNKVIKEVKMDALQLAHWRDTFSKADMKHRAELLAARDKLGAIKAGTEGQNAAGFMFKSITGMSDPAQVERELKLAMENFSVMRDQAIAKGAAKGAAAQAKKHGESFDRMKELYVARFKKNNAARIKEITAIEIAAEQKRVRESSLGVGISTAGGTALAMANAKRKVEKAIQAMVDKGQFPTVTTDAAHALVEASLKEFHAGGDLEKRLSPQAKKLAALEQAAANVKRLKVLADIPRELKRIEAKIGKVNEAKIKKQIVKLMGVVAMISDCVNKSVKKHELDKKTQGISATVKANLLNIKEVFLAVSDVTKTYTVPKKLVDERVGETTYSLGELAKMKAPSFIITGAKGDELAKNVSNLKKVFDSVGSITKQTTVDSKVAKSRIQAIASALNDLSLLQPKAFSFTGQLATTVFEGLRNISQLIIGTKNQRSIVSIISRIPRSIEKKAKRGVKSVKAINKLLSSEGGLSSPEFKTNLIAVFKNLSAITTAGNTAMQGVDMTFVMDKMFGGIKSMDLVLGKYKKKYYGPRGKVARVVKELTKTYNDVYERLNNLSTTPKGLDLKLSQFALALGTGTDTFTIKNEKLNFTINVKVEIDANKLSDVLADEKVMDDGKQIKRVAVSPTVAKPPR